MTTHEVMLYIVAPTSVAVFSAILILLCKRANKFFVKLNKAFFDIAEMKQNGEQRKKENMLLFESQMVMFDVLKGEEVNGNVTALQEKFELHLRNEAIH